MVFREEGIRLTLDRGVASLWGRRCLRGQASPDLVRLGVARVSQRGGSRGQPGMLLILIFAEALALYGLIVGIILSSAGAAGAVKPE